MPDQTKSSGFQKLPLLTNYFCFGTSTATSCRNLELAHWSYCVCSSWWHPSERRRRRLTSRRRQWEGRDDSLVRNCRRHGLSESETGLEVDREVNQYCKLASSYKVGMMFSRAQIIEMRPLLSCMDRLISQYSIPAAYSTKPWPNTFTLETAWGFKVFFCPNKAAEEALNGAYKA